MTEPLEPHAPRQGATLYGRRYTAGEFEPFYVPRPFMPQIDESDFPALFAFATARGVRWERVTVSPDAVSFHQRVDHDRARHMAPAVLAKPILISAEPYVLDGNHRLWEHKALGTPVSAYQFALEWDAALAFLFAFPKTYTFATPQPERN